MSAAAVVLVCFGAINIINGKTVPDVDAHHRNARWLGYRYTTTIVQPALVTSLIPSSCVHVMPSLPPCRNVRQLDAFPQFAGSQQFEGRELGLDNPVVEGPVDASLSPDSAIDQVVFSTPLGWGEYLGLYAPTVTVKSVQLQTTTVLDPRVVVTFSVKGCKPSRLPLDLAECPGSQQQISPTAPQEIVTTTVHAIDHNDLASMTALGVNNPANLPQYVDAMPVSQSEPDFNVNVMDGGMPTVPLVPMK